MSLAETVRHGDRVCNANGFNRLLVWRFGDAPSLDSCASCLAQLRPYCTIFATASPTIWPASRCERFVVMCTVSSATWLDAQHQYEATAVRARRRTALHAVVAMV